MAISDLTMSDNEARSSYSNGNAPRPAVASTARNSKPHRRHHHVTSTAPAPQPTNEASTPKKGWGQKLRSRLFGSRKPRNRRAGLKKAASSAAVVTQSRAISTSVFTQSNPPLHHRQEMAEPHSYGGAPTSQFTAPRPTAYHGSFYGGSTTSISARDFRQPMNSYAYTREDESYANLANQQIDEDLEVSYFNV